VLNPQRKAVAAFLKPILQEERIRDALKIRNENSEKNSIQIRTRHVDDGKSEKT
jgi:hypothetical protein